MRPTGAPLRLTVLVGEVVDAPDRVRASVRPAEADRDGPVPS